MSDKNIIPSDLLPFFSQIAERMWSGHAAVMIGAGFSKNAKKNDSAQKDFPDWNQLGDVFFEKINGNIPSDEKYLNVLKLADEVQAAFGRSALENILRTEIPDKYYQPSSLHENLMQLPWTDIFTTNYDTLLERTAENITNRRFDVVIKKEDLFYAAKPRIIKLHGSFTAERPLIITEEDYRKYPTEFAPFVNTVQQSLLENTLCLLGFSSDDPNFLKWIGWIRDNLGKQSSPKIYLIGILTLSVGQKNLLVERNIIPLDLSRCRGVNNDHEKAISIFLNFLKDKGEIEEKLDWPNQSIHFFYNPIDPEAQKLMPILKSWISLRKEYPNWLIVPEDRREILKSETDRCHQFIYNLSNEIAPIDIQFLYEYNWRIEKCLMPIDSKLINDYENIVNKYNPFPNIVNIDNAIKPESKNKNEIDWKDITSKWFEIQISMLRYYREEGIHEKWQVISIRLNILIEILEPELQSRYRYERCLYHLFALNIYEVRKELDQWSTNVSLPYWEAKRAGLLSEIGEVFEAEKILETSLITVRKRLNLTPVVNDYSNVSQEAYIMQLLQHVKSASAIIRGTYSVIDDISKSYSERWNALIQYKCDPWLELKLFEAYLDKDSINFKSIEKICGFDIGSTSTIHYYGRGDKYILKAYSFLRYIEEIGFPYHISGTTFGKEAAVGAIKLIAKDSSYWALASLLRISDLKYIDLIFNRKFISQADSAYVETQISKYLSVLQESVSEIEKGDEYRNFNFAISISTVIPEILSRLCTKGSYEVNLMLLLFLKDIYNSDIKDRYKGILNLTERLIKSFSNSEQYKIIPILLDFPILPETNHFIDKEYTDPFEYIEINKSIINQVLKININSEIIEKLFELTLRDSIERQKAIIRLIKLWKLDILDGGQTHKLGELLWRNIDPDSKFPKGLKYYYYAYINMPHPKSINPKKLLSQYIIRTDFSVKSLKEGRRIIISNGDIRVVQEINGTSYTSIRFKWTENEIAVLINKAIKWWDSDKIYLSKEDTSTNFGSIPNEFRARLKNLVILYSSIFGPNYKIINELLREELRRVIYEIEEFGFLVNEALASCYYLFSINQDEIYSIISENMFSKSEDKVYDALKGVVRLLEMQIKDVIKLVYVVSEQIKNRTEVKYASLINAMTVVVTQYPDSLNNNIFTNLMVGLNNLISETKISSADNPDVVNNKISYKIEIAKLTVELNKYFKMRNLEVPEFIIKWKSLCLDKNEFSEIRNIWEDAMSNTNA